MNMYNQQVAKFVDDDGDEMSVPPPSPPRTPMFQGPGLSSKLADFEAILGLAFTGFITFIGVILIGVGVLQYMIYHRPHPPQWMWAVAAPGGLLLIFLQWKSMQTMAATLEDAAHPRPVNMALGTREWPAILRPVVAAWWLGQCAILIAAARVMSQSYGFVNPTPGVHAFELGLQATILFMGAYASTCSLLFAAAALSRHAGLLRGIWRLRFVIDLGLAVLVSMLWPDGVR